MIITINGTPGSGKTTLAKALAKKYRLKFYSVGQIRRKIAKIFGLNIERFNKIGRETPFTDLFVDEMIRKIVKDNAVIDGRLSWKFFPESIKILLICDIDVAAKRLLKDKRKEEKYKNLYEVRKKILKRIKDDEYRYKKYYGIKNIFDIKKYDIVLETSKVSKKEMIKICFEIIENYFLKKI